MHHLRAPLTALIPLVALIAIAALAIALDGPAAAAGATYYVSPSGSDNGPGSQQQPFATIQKGADVAGPGDTVQIAAGVYEPFTIDNSGTSGSPITFRGTVGAWADGNCDDYAMHIEADYIVIEDLGARRSNEEVVRLDAADFVTLDGMTVTDWNCGEGEDQYRAGIASWFGGRALTVTDSYLERRVTVAGSDVGFGNGIWVKNTGAAAGGGHEFTGNTIIGGWDGIGGEPEDETWGVFNGNTTIANNTISECDDDGIQVEGGTHNITVSGNHISGCLIGIAFAPALGGPFTILRNVIVGPQPRRGEGPAMFKAGDNSTGEVMIYHNSFFAGSLDADGFKQTNSNLRNIRLLNNAIFAGRYTWETSSHTGTVTADYDALYTTDNDRFAKWDDTQYSDLDDLQSDEGQEMHGISPGNFSWNGNLVPLPSSPLIDAGVVIPGVNDGYGGGAPDIGAYELGGSGPPPPPPAPTSSPEPTIGNAAADADCDGLISANDVMWYLQVIAGLTPLGCLHLVDLNCDGLLTGNDALIVLAFLAASGPPIPDGCPLP